jgi:hypothetical protein
MTTIERAEEPDDPDLLLPWLAAGTLTRRDAQRVEAALASEPELRRRYALVRDELSEDIHLNETLGAPSARALERLTAAIDAEPPRAARRRSFDIGGWIAAQLAQFSPRALGWSASAAALVIALQGGLLAGLYVGERPVAYPVEETRGVSDAPATRSLASVPDNTTVGIGFAPEATAAEITRFLETYDAVVVDGPRGGLYTIRLASARRSKAEIADVLRRMQVERRIVRLFAPSQ